MYIGKYAITTKEKRGHKSESHQEGIVGWFEWEEREEGNGVITLESQNTETIGKSF